MPMLYKRHNVRIDMALSVYRLFTSMAESMSAIFNTIRPGTRLNFGVSLMTHSSVLDH